MQRTKKKLFLESRKTNRLIFWLMILKHDKYIWSVNRLLTRNRCKKPSLKKLLCFFKMLKWIFEGVILFIAALLLGQCGNYTKMTGPRRRKSKTFYPCRSHCDTPLRTAGWREFDAIPFTSPFLLFFFSFWWGRINNPFVFLHKNKYEGESKGESKGSRKGSRKGSQKGSLLTVDSANIAWGAKESHSLCDLLTQRKFTDYAFVHPLFVK